MIEKCTVEKNDRDDVSFEMSFDYEFVEDFYVDRSNQEKTTPTINATNVIFSGGRQEGVPGTREEGEKTAVVELRDVTVVKEGEEDGGEEKENDQLDGGDDPAISGSSPPVLVINPRRACAARVTVVVV